jgi:hypothetical protein
MMQCFSYRGRPAGIYLQRLSLLITLFLCTTAGFSQNPLIQDQYTADPSARVFDGKVYVYPSHDILATEGKGRKGWFCMEDYHVFSSSDLAHWQDHGVIVSQTKVPWANPTGYSMWAPDCIFRNGKYYFYFPTAPKDTIYGRGFAIGVAIADRPEGPFVPQPAPILKVHGIDPNVFIDKDGQAYLYWSAGNIFAAKLKENMTELATDPIILQDLPGKGLKEGPYLFERNGIYYLTFPHVENKTERLEYATADNPLGPFKMTGVIMDETPGCWTNHHSIINFREQWILFYHSNDLSPSFDKNRSIRADSLFFNSDGTIRKVTPTLRGVGLTNATDKIQVDRFSAISGSDVKVNFGDTTEKFKGWTISYHSAGSWSQYNSVDFGSRPLKTIIARIKSGGSTALEIRLDSEDGPLLAVIRQRASLPWKEVRTGVKNLPKGVHNIFLVCKGQQETEVDWIKFE